MAHGQVKLSLVLDVTMSLGPLQPIIQDFVEEQREQLQGPDLVRHMVQCGKLKEHTLTLGESV